MLVTAMADVDDHDAVRPQGYRSACGEMVHADASALFGRLEGGVVDLVMTSPPFALTRSKEYGNVDADAYVDWFTPVGRQIQRVLRPTGSLVLDIGGAWTPGLPTRRLYHFELLVSLVRDLGFHLAQEFYWYNPSRLPTPAEWVTVRRVRVKDAVNTIWWLSKTPHPKADNRQVLRPYSDSQQALMRDGYKAARRPSGHVISESGFSKNNGGAIPPNLLTIANTESNTDYLKRCRSAGSRPHPARYPRSLVEFFVKFLTDAGDLVVDPFAGSNVTGMVCEDMGRRWLSGDVDAGYVANSRLRFPQAVDLG